MEQTANHNTSHLLRRNTRDGKIAGVSAGIGDYLGIDPVLVRLLFVLLVFAGGFGLLAYLVAWLVIPPEDESQSLAADFERRLPPSRTHWRTILGGLILVIGIFAFVGSVGIWWLPNIEVWPLILIAVGAGLLLLRRRDDALRDDGPGRDDGADPPSSEPDPAAPTSGGPAGDPMAGVPVPDDDSDQVDETAGTSDHEPSSAVATPDEEQAFAPSEATAVAPLSRATAAPDPSEAQWSPAPEPPEKKRRRFPVGRATLGAILIAAAVAGLLDATGVVDVSAQAFLILALAITGGGLVASAFFGRSIGLVFLAVLLALLLALASLVSNVSLTEGAGDRTVRPATVAELEESYELSAGKLTVDLRALDLAGADAVVDADVGVGELVLLVPVGVDAAIEGKAAMGEVDLFGRIEGGLDVERSADVSGVTLSAGPPPYPGFPPQPAPPAGSLQIEADVGIGKVEARLVRS